MTCDYGILICKILIVIKLCIW